MADEPRLIVALEARLDEFEKNLREAGLIAERQMKGIESTLKRGVGDIEAAFSFIKGFGEALLGAFSINQLRRIVDSVADLADNAERVAVSTDALQTLRFAMEQAGGSTSQLDSALERFAVNIGKAADGTSFLARTFEANNVAMREANGQFKSQEQLLQSFADLVRAAGSEQDKLRLATQAFGPAGARMLGTLNDIAERGLPAVIAEAKNAGVVIDAELVKRADDFDKAWSAALAAATVSIKSFALSIIDAVSTWVRELERVPLAGRTFEEFQRGAEAAGKSIEQLRQETAAPLKVEVRPVRPPTIIPPTRAPAEREDPFERQAASIEKHIAVMKADTEAVFLGVGAQEAFRTEAKLLEAAQRDGLAVTDQQRARIQELSSAAGAAALALSEARAQFQLFKSIGTKAIDGFADAFVEAASGAKSFEEAFRQMTQSVLKDIARLLIKQGLLSAFTAFGIPGFAPGRMAGGPVIGGRAFVVGERGPELFVPSTSGVIVPNAAVSQIGGGGTVINMPINSVVNAPAGMNKAELQSVLAIERRRMRAEVVPIIKTAASRGAL
jgi:hypothetical protein